MKNDELYLNKNTYDNYIVDIEDYLNLPENIQDLLASNPYLEYEKIWDKLDSEIKFLILQRSDFKYEELWYKLHDLEKKVVIQYVTNFDYEKYIPHPSEEELKLLINRKDFKITYEIFNKIDENSKNIICNKEDFDYQNYWQILKPYMKLLVIKNNLDFDPELYIDEFVTINYRYDRLSTKSILDEYCDRKISKQIHYEKIWSKLNDFQKLSIVQNNNLYVVNNKNEILDLLKKYPYKMIDFIKYKVQTSVQQSNILANQIIDFDQLSENIRELTLDIFKTLNIINYEEITQYLQKNGNLFEFSIKNIILICCIVKVNNFNGTNCTIQKIKSGYYFLETIPNKLIPIKNFNYILRELKLKRLLNNQ